MWSRTSSAGAVVFARRSDDPHAVLSAVLAVACFCLLSSAVYVFNDIVDVDKDRAHPLKRLRPIASGALSVRNAWALAAILALVGLGGKLPDCPPTGGHRRRLSGAERRLLLLAESTAVRGRGVHQRGFSPACAGGACAISVDPRAGVAVHPCCWRVPGFRQTRP